MYFIVAAIIELSIHKLPIIVNQLGLVLESISKVIISFYNILNLLLSFYIRIINHPRNFLMIQISP